MAEEKLLNRVQALLDQANHPNTGAGEREAFLQKADALMHRYRIDEAMLAGRSGLARGPSQPEMECIAFADKDGELYGPISTVATWLARLATVRLIVTGSAQLSVIGFPDDIEYFKMLWMAAYSTYVNKLYPRWDVSKTLAWNIRRQKEAGVKWGDIYDAAIRAGWSGYRYPGKVDVMTPVFGATADTFVTDLNAKVDPLELSIVRVNRCPNDKGYFKRLYEKQCELDGVPPTNHTQRNAAYRESYAYGFLDEVATRVSKMLQYRRAQERQTGNGAELVLIDRDDAIRRMFESLFPKTSISYTKRQHGTELLGSEAGHSAGQHVDLSGGRGHLRTNDRELEA